MAPGEFPRSVSDRSRIDDRGVLFASEKLAGHSLCLTPLSHPYTIHLRVQAHVFYHYRGRFSAPGGVIQPG